MLIIGDGIREGVENIVDFVQRHSGLHFNLALVEAALYRDAEEHLIVQPRVLARTEIMHRMVIDEGIGSRVGPEPEPLPYEEQNLQFWTKVLKGYSFNIVVPPACRLFPQPLHHRVVDVERSLHMETVSPVRPRATVDAERRGYPPTVVNAADGRSGT